MHSKSKIPPISDILRREAFHQQFVAIKGKFNITRLICILPSDHLIFINRLGKIEILDFASGKREEFTRPEDQTEVTSITVSPDGNYLYATCFKEKNAERGIRELGYIGYLLIWELSKKGDPIDQLYVDESINLDSEFHISGFTSSTLIITCNNSGTLYQAEKVHKTDNNNQLRLIKLGCLMQTPDKQASLYFSLARNLMATGEESEIVFHVLTDQGFKKIELATPIRYSGKMATSVSLLLKNYLFISHELGIYNSHVITIIDVSDLKNPKWINTLETGDKVVALRTDAKGNLVYFTTPTSSRLINGYQYPLNKLIPQLGEFKTDQSAEVDVSALTLHDKLQLSISKAEPSKDSEAKEPISGSSFYISANILGNLYTARLVSLPTGQLIFINKDGDIECLDIRSNTRKVLIGPQDGSEITSIKLSPDGQYLYASFFKKIQVDESETQIGYISVWNLATQSKQPAEQIYVSSVIAVNSAFHICGFSTSGLIVTCNGSADLYHVTGFFSAAPDVNLIGNLIRSNGEKSYWYFNLCKNLIATADDGEIELYYLKEKGFEKIKFAKPICYAGKFADCVNLLFNRYLFISHRMASSGLYAITIYDIIDHENPQQISSTEVADKVIAFGTDGKGNLIYFTQNKGQNLITGFLCPLNQLIPNINKWFLSSSCQPSELKETSPRSPMPVLTVEPVMQNKSLFFSDTKVTLGPDEKALQIFAQCIDALCSNEEFMMNLDICSDFILVYARYFEEKGNTDTNLATFDLVALDAYKTYFMLQRDDKLVGDIFKGFKDETQVEDTAESLTGFFDYFKFSETPTLRAKKAHPYPDEFLKDFIEAHIDGFESLLDLTLIKLSQAELISDLLSYIGKNIYSKTYIEMRKHVPDSWQEVAQIFLDGACELTQSQAPRLIAS